MSCDISSSPNQIAACQSRPISSNSTLVLITQYTTPITSNNVHFFSIKTHMFFHETDYRFMLIKDTDMYAYAKHHFIDPFINVNYYFYLYLVFAHCVVNPEGCITHKLVNIQTCHSLLCRFVHIAAVDKSEVIISASCHCVYNFYVDSMLY